MHEERYADFKEMRSLHVRIACPRMRSCTIAFTSLRTRAPACRCSAQGMLDLSDSALLQQCHDAVSAAEGQLTHRPTKQYAHSLSATKSEPVTARRDEVLQSTKADESAAQLKSQPAREVKPLRQADKQVRPLATMATGKMAEPSNAGPAACQTPSIAGSAGEFKGGERLVSSAATISTGEAASPPGAQCASAQPVSDLPARSLLDVLLGDPAPLPAAPALAVTERLAFGGSSCALQEPGPRITGDPAIDKHDDALPASPKPSRVEPAKEPLQYARLKHSLQPESSPPMPMAAPSPEIHAGSTLLQPEQGPVKKLLSLRERLALLRGST